MTPFQTRTEKTIDDRRNRQPTYLTGVMVKTSDVIQDTLSNPWFLSTRQMAPIYGDQSALVRDWNKDGISVVATDYERPESRKPWTYVSTLIPGIQGGPSGKPQGFSSYQSTAQSFNYVHMMANRKETPTGVTVHNQTLATTVDPNTQTTHQDVVNNQPPPLPQLPVDPANSPAFNPLPGSFQFNPQTDTSTPGPFDILNKVQRDINYIRGIFQVKNTDGMLSTTTTVTQPMNPPINPQAVDINERGQRVQTRASNTGSQQSRIQTGATMMTNTQLRGLIGLHGKGIK